MALEIERRFLITGAVDLTGCRSLEIEQRYLQADVAEHVERIRRVRDGAQIRLIHTTKRPVTNMSSEEIERDLTPTEFDEFASRAGPTLRKIRTLVPCGDLTIEVDRFLNPELAGLVIAEVELPSEDKPFEPPHWLGREITGDRSFANAALARRLES